MSYELQVKRLNEQFARDVVEEKTIHNRLILEYALKCKLNLILLLFVFLFSIFSPIAPVEGDTRFVPSDYDTIQGAVDSAEVGDIIVVAEGVYHESITINKAIQLMGSDSVIDGGGESFCIKVSAPDITITGFILQNANKGVLLQGVNNVEISNNVIQKLVGHDNEAIMADYNYDDYNVKILNNIITDNRRGIHLIDSHNFTIRNNRIYDNVDFGIRILTSTEGSITRNDIENNSIGVQVVNSRNVLVEYNILSATSRETWIEGDTSSITVLNNNLEGSGIQDSEPEPEPEPEQKGIPGFPIISVMIGILVGGIILGQQRILIKF